MEGQVRPAQQRGWHRLRHAAAAADNCCCTFSGLCGRCRRVAVEVDGPDHFTASSPHAPLGSTRAKQRCLQARGWAVLSVRFHDWAELGRGSQDQAAAAAARAAYLAARLDDAVAAPDLPLELLAPPAAAVAGGGGGGAR